MGKEGLKAFLETLNQNVFLTEYACSCEVLQSL